MADKFFLFYIEQEAKNIAGDYFRLLQSKGFGVTDFKKENYCYTFSVTDGKTKVKVLVYYGKNGIKTLIQGSSASSLYVKVNSIILNNKLEIIEETITSEPLEYIGTDECGKGDVFGPLVIAGCYLKADQIKDLKRIGIVDSKKLTDTMIDSLAEEIRKRTSDYFVLVLEPNTYNKLYEKYGNLNTLLAKGHAKVIEELLKKVDTKNIIVDKFANERVLTSELLKLEKKLNVIQEIKGERYTSVAAASILARNALNVWFRKTSGKYGVEFKKGSSKSAESFLSSLLKTIDEQELNNLVKMHFKTLKKDNIVKKENNG